MKRGNALLTTLRGVIGNSHAKSLTPIFSGQITLILASDTYLRRTVFARGGDLMETYLFAKYNYDARKYDFSYPDPKRRIEFWRECS